MSIKTWFTDLLGIEKRTNPPYMTVDAMKSISEVLDAELESKTITNYNLSAVEGGLVEVTISKNFSSKTFYLSKLVVKNYNTLSIVIIRNISDLNMDLTQSCCPKLDELDKQILFHIHESKRLRFYGRPGESESHKRQANLLKNLKDGK